MKNPLAKKDNNKDDKKDKKKKEKPKPNFEPSRIRISPHDSVSTLAAVKPGHWINASMRMKANNFDVVGELHSAAVANQGRPINLRGTLFFLDTNRPASLAKGQAKTLETTFFVPVRRQKAGSNVMLQTRLRGRNGGREDVALSEAASSMPDYQYYFVVLADTPDSYGYLKSLDSVKAPWPENFTFQQGSFDTFYRVVLPKTEGRVPLPNHPLTWTSIAIVLWDDVGPETLSTAQQQAMIHWLHWGGQLIISGPKTLDRLKSGFLADYLPATTRKVAKLVQEDVLELSKSWRTQSEQKRVLRRLRVARGRPLDGIELELQANATFVPKTGQLLAERRVGRGRVLVTAFSMADRRVVNWGNFDGFFNGCVLRRPPRIFEPVQDGDARVRWADKELWSRRVDPRLISNLRYFSRDVGRRLAVNNPVQLTDQQVAAAAAANLAANLAGNLTGMQNTGEGYGKSPGAGVAGWSDFSGASNAARQSLKEAAGLAIPDAGFVIGVLGLYLLILVPLNWVVFWAIGRVEWAWAAVPVIAIVFAMLVVRLAQLDIGFARNRTEIAILELHGGYDRGHLTRYTALYTSLSSNYTFNFDDDTALAQPFPANPNFSPRLGQPVTTVTLERRGGRVNLNGFRVMSNRTDMIHSEQLIDLKGDIRFIDVNGGARPRGGGNSTYKIENNSPLELQGVGVIRKTEAGDVRVAWLGKLAAEATFTLKFHNPIDPEKLLTQWDDSPTTAGPPAELLRLRAELKTAQNAQDQAKLESLRGEIQRLEQDISGDRLSLYRLLNLARDAKSLRPGDVRLIGWTEEMPGMSIEPAASQFRYRTLVVAHLRYGDWPAPRPDVNVKKEVQDEVAAAQGGQGGFQFVDSRGGQARPVPTARRSSRAQRP